jgi:ribose 5-phosphate isomerase B
MTEEIQKIYIACDHRGFLLKQKILTYLTEIGLIVEDFGCFSEEMCDYPIFVHNALKEMTQNIKHSKAIFICGSGVGVSIVANRYVNIRAYLFSDLEILKSARKHNDINALCLGANNFDESKIDEVIQCFLNTEFEGERHITRIALIDKLKT